MESEYITAADAANEPVWLRKFIIVLRVFHGIQDPVKIYCDNTGAIANTKEPRSHSMAKHILRRFHMIRQYIREGEIKICKVRTDLNVEDPLTKHLSRAMHDQHRDAIGVRFLPDVN